MSTLDWLTPANIAGFIAPSDRYQVLATSQTQELSGDRLVDVLEVVFTITGREGAFTFVINIDNPIIRETGISLDSTVDVIEGIFNLPS